MKFFIFLKIIVFYHMTTYSLANSEYNTHSIYSNSNNYSKNSNNIRIQNEFVSADCKRIEQFCRTQVRDRLEWGKLNDESIEQALADKDLILACQIARYFSQPKVQEKKLCEALKDAKFVDWLFTCPNLFEDLAFANQGTWNTLGILRTIWQKEEGKLDGTLLNLAAGIALNANEYPEEELLARYDFYKQAYTNKNLFGQFNTLKPWEMAIVVKTIQHIGQIEDYTWAQQYLATKTKIKEDNIGQTACGLIPYRDKNKNGISVHAGGAFYDNNPVSLKIYTEYGGVCGAVSKGASGFCRVKGIPAYPVGQPGHCAFIWKKPGNHWVIGNNVCGGWNWSNGNGPIPWKGPTACIQALDHYLSMEKADESTNAYYCSLLVQSPTVKDRLLTYALQKNRKNYPAWQELLNGMKKKQGLTPEQISTTALELNRAFEEEPAVLEHLINNHLAPAAKKVLAPFQLSALMLDRIETGESRDIYLRNLWKLALKDIPVLSQMKVSYDQKTSDSLLNNWAAFYRKNDKMINSTVKKKTCAFLQQAMASLREHRKTRSEMIDFYLKFLMEWQDDRYFVIALEFVDSELKAITDQAVLKDTLALGIKLAELRKSKPTVKKYQDQLDALASN